MFEERDEFAKLHLEFVNSTPPEELFHYTSGKSCLAILNSQFLLASERSFLNDSQEFIWVKEALKAPMQRAGI